jgi:hypothetical protein
MGTYHYQTPVFQIQIDYVQIWIRLFANADPDTDLSIAKKINANPDPVKCLHFFSHAMFTMHRKFF